MRHDKDRRVERWLLTPRLLAAVGHPPAHDVRPGRVEGLGDDLRIRVVLAAGEAQPLAPGHRVDHPPGDPEDAALSAEFIQFPSPEN
jgi:hypothetical protein